MSPLQSPKLVVDWSESDHFHRFYIEYTSQPYLSAQILNTLMIRRYHKYLNPKDLPRKIGCVCWAHVIPHLINFATLLTITLKLKQCHRTLRKTWTSYWRRIWLLLYLPCNLKCLLNAEVLEEIRKLNSKFDILQSDHLITKKVNSELSSRLVNMERQRWTNAQYWKRECLELVSIPKGVEQKDLEGKVLSVLEKVGCKIDPDNIEDCHRLSKKNDNVIIKFSRRKDCQHFHRVKRDLRNLNLEDLGFHGENRIYINRSLCQYYRMLWSKSKKLHSMGRIHSFYIADESIKIKVHENSTPLAIIHVNYFEYNFPDVDLSPTSTSLSG